MRRLRAGIRRFAGLFRSGARERELQAELESHLQLHIDDNIRAGLPPEEARRAAILKFGPIEAIKEGVRDRGGMPILTAFIRDSGFALRMLRRQPGFAGAAVVTLALGIGANSAVFSVVDALLLRPLPYGSPDRIVQIKGSAAQSFMRSDERRAWISPDVAESPAFAGMAYYVAGAVNFGGEPAERLRAAEVSTDFFEVMGASAHLGRTFRDTDAQSQVAVISDRLWRDRFQAGSSVLGRQLLLDGTRFEIVGVMPPGVDFPESSRIWVPTHAPTQVAGWVYIYVIMARLSDGASLPDALRDVVRRSGLSEARAAQLQLVPLREMLAGSVRPVALLVWVASGLVLLIACINTANLLLARVVSREREFAVRRALGASRVQIVRQVAAESLVLACLGAVAALPAAFWTIEAIRRLLPPTLHGVEGIGLDSRTLIVTFGVTVLTAILFGVGPIVSIPRRTAADALRGMAATRVDRFWGRFRSVLVVGEVALAFVLLTAAVSLVGTLRTIMSVDTGVRGQGALAFEMNLPTTSYPTLAQRRQFFAQLESTLRAVPDVEAVGITHELPGRPAALRAEQVLLLGQVSDASRGVGITASPGYFEAAGIDVIAGRMFTRFDTPPSGPVVIVSEGFARNVGLLPADLIGRMAIVYQGDDRPRQAEIVGVVRDVRMRGPEGEYFTAIYSPLAANPLMHAASHVVVRAGGDPMVLIPSIRAAVAGLDATLPLYRIQTLDEILANRLADRRFAMRMLVTFAAMGVVLALIGLYSVVSYLVHIRTREIGIRLAIGATPGDVLRHVMASGFTHASLGVLIGTAAIVATARLVIARVPGIGSVDPAVVATLAAAIVGVALAATWIPAARAARIDPAVTLRSE